MSTPEIAKPRRYRTGSRMRELQDMVSATPGCTKSDALRAADLPTRGMVSGRSLNRAIGAGLILVEYEHSQRCPLFATERDRQWWHLRRELRAAGTTAERGAEIRAEIAALEAASAASWVALADSSDEL